MNRRTLFLLLALAAALFAALALGGCATTWDHPSKGVADYHRDIYECQRDSAALPPTSTDALVMRHRCMKLRGWRSV